MKTLLIALLACSASVAHAETRSLAADALMKAPLRQTTAGVAIDLTSPRAAFNPRYSDAPEARVPGVAKTSVDRRYDEGVVGSLGFLCGLEAGSGRDKGVAAMHGYDPSGRFVGAKLRVAFR